MSARSYFQVSMAIARDQRMVKAMTLAGESAAVLWLFALAWSRSELTDGVIPAALLPVIHPLSSKPIVKVAEALVTVGLWRKRADGDYEIAGFLDWNPSKEKVEAKLESDRRRKPGASDSARNPDGKATGSVETPTGTRSEKKGREERGERKEEINKPLLQRAGVGATPAATESANPDAVKILDRLRSHPELEAIATIGHAERIAGLLIGGGKRLDWLLAAVDELADKASAAALTGSPWNAEFMGGKAMAFGRSARAPKVDATPGVAPSEAQILAEQKRKGVQPGTEKWTGGAGSFTDGDDHAS